MSYLSKSRHKCGKSALSEEQTIYSIGDKCKSILTSYIETDFSDEIWFEILIRAREIFFEDLVSTIYKVTFDTTLKKEQK